MREILSAKIWPRLIRRILRIILYFGIFLAIMTGGIYALLQTETANDYLRRGIISVLEGATRTRVEIGQLTGNLITGATLKDAAIYNPAGEEPLFAFDTIRVNYALPLLITGRFYIPSIKVDGFSSYLAADPDNRWNTAALLPPEREPEPEAPGPPGNPFKLVIGEVTVKNARMGLAWYAGGNKQELLFTDGNCRARLTIGSCIDIGIRHLDFHMPWPDVTFKKVTGGVAFDIPSTRLGFDATHFRTAALSDLTVNGGVSFAGGARFDMGAEIAALAAEEIGRLFSMPFLKATMAGRLEVSGTIDALAHRLELERDRMRLETSGVIDFSDPGALALETIGSVSHYNPETFPFYSVEGLSGDISAEFRVQAEQLASPENRCIEIEVSTGASEFSGYSVDKAQIQAAFSAAEVEIEQFQWNAPYGDVRARGRIGSLFDADAKKPFDIRANAIGFNPAVIPHPGAPAGALNFDLELRGILDKSYRPEKSDIDLIARVHPSTLRELQNLSGELDLSWSKHRLTVRQVDLRSDQGMLDATGKIDFTDDACRLGFTAGANDLRAFSIFVPGDGSAFAISGAAKLNGQLSGIWYRPDFVLNGELEDLKTREFSAARGILKAKGTLTPQGIRATGDLSGKGITCNGVAVSELAADWSMSPDRITVAGELSADTNRAVLSGAIAGWRHPEKAVRLDKFHLFAADLPPLVNTQPISFQVSGNRLTVDCLHLQSEDATLSATGNIDLVPGGRLASHLRIDGFRLQRLSGVIPALEQIEGTLSGDIRLSNTLAEPVIEARADLTACGCCGVLLSRLDAAAAFRSGCLAFSAEGFRDELRALTAQGELRGRLSLYPFAWTPEKEGFAADIAASGFRLAEFDLPFSDDYEADGLLNLKARLTGEIDSPQLTGTLSVSEADLNFPEYGLTYETAKGDIDFLGNTMVIRNFEIKGDKEGELKASGRIACTGFFEPEAFDIAISGTDFQIPFRNAVFIRTEPELALKGTPHAPALTGRIAVAGGRVYLDRLMKQQPAEIEVIEPVRETDGTYLLADSPSPLSFLEPLAADILIEIKDDLWIKGKEENLEITGRIRLDKAHEDAIRLHGSLRSVRGTYLFRNRLFKITTGEIRFLGLEEIDPNVNIEARSRLQDITIIIRLTGTFRNLQLTLDSQPQMQTIDIISYMMFGRPADELSQGESYRAEDAALSITGQLAANQLKAILGESFRLDLLHISTGNGDISKGAVSLGKYIAPNVFVTYNQGFSQEVPRSFEVDYEITRHFSLSAQVDEERTSAVDLIWKHDYSGFLEFLFGED